MMPDGPQTTPANPVTDSACPVCTAPAPHFLQADGYDYFRCPTCQARFLDPVRHPSRDAEKTTYLLHENDPGDPRYRRFLSKLADPLMTRLAPDSQGLDYGCGPGPALAHMLREAGHEVALFDPFFAPDPAPLNRTYDFVTCTEVAEHFHHPASEFDRLFGLVRPGGWLAIMTCFQTDDARFANWYYRKDPTHVVFYREDTFRYLAGRKGWRCEVPIKDVAFMQCPEARQ
ncbi:class I SAM-dependent methyltransferase [Lutimaribacter sp. EGI FJ00015]|uniref:Class I SAM-dependent methyltransferase n=1 Tax=Lutimaribacter degradans TaxID=2945989 RepID=A0ACC5ZTN7_9RHOB|nr:class I SAM-dependent methyltransferase [Lutimaribacter sp. EGI FJ00013]MCM2561686.1 class I SAM-dependent methyltransferase [Lutimaribacter sp. EGI FJ00013]MCO0612601.1 class I SAM-dependent methyltransferase [Lutimaribacter sp. EGI FJ00015]MCO0635260.1 class I SAM-dependent methyltransferase [Lutimaribacter sp. EGI FJ00014]